MPPHELTGAEALALLREGTIEVEGRMPWSSNATFLVTLCHGDVTGQAVYKPLRGERPLWDFAPGLHKREVAAYELSAALGWGVVPETVLRTDAPFGEGSLQRFVPADFEHHYFTILESRPDLHDQLRAICLFDLLANNTDRKGGHCLLAGDRVYAIDNGLCFSAEPKIRTVIWEFGGQAIPERLLDDVERTMTALPAAFTDLLDDEEVEAVRARAERVLRARRFPTDPTGRRYPWPLV